MTTQKGRKTKKPRSGVREKTPKVRYGVIGLGYIAQVAVLPAFQHASSNSELVALVSGDEMKLRELGERYDVEGLYTYDAYEDLLTSGTIDAVYIALPNDKHREFTVMAAENGIHVLCEKPMAVTERECTHMIDVCRENNVRLMIAYRLHFEEANLKAIELVNSGKIGEPRFFSSVFSMQVNDNNIRLEAERGGGPIYDIGIYCLNAARYIFQSEPIEVSAFAARGRDRRFREVDEMITVSLRFPWERLATFTASFGASDLSSYRVVGTKGDLVVEPAYDYSVELGHCLTIDGKSREKTFKKRDQFAPEIIHFSDCVRTGTEPVASGGQGLADVRLIEAIQKSVREHRAVQIPPMEELEYPNLSFEMRRPPVKEPKLIHAQEAAQS